MAYTAQQLEDILGAYLPVGGSFIHALRQVYPRLVDMGLWRDMAYEVSMSGQYGYVSLPADTDAVLACTINDFPRNTRSQWHDVRLVGRQPTLSNYFGIVDDGFHPVLLDMKDVQGVAESADVAPVSQLNAYLSGTTTAVAAEDYAGAVSISGVTASGRSSTLAQPDSDYLRFVVALSVVAETGSVLTDGTDPVEFPPLFLAGDRVWENGTFLASWNGESSKWELRDSDSGAEWDSPEDVATPDLVSGWTAISPATGNPVVTITPPPITAITSITYDDVPAAFDLVDPDFPDKVIATVPAGSGVLRFRRFRTSNKAPETTIHLLVKRGAPSNITPSTIIHLGNLGAIKHGILGLIAEDNADLERANYHWGLAGKLLDQELASMFGSAKPTLRLHDVAASGITNFY